MKISHFFSKNFSTAKDEVGDGRLQNSNSSSYELAFIDRDFLLREELRPVRLQLELLKPEIVQQEQNITSTVVIFGSARIADEATAKAKVVEAEEALAADPNNKLLQQQAAAANSLLNKSKFFEEARRLSGIITNYHTSETDHNPYVVTGGGPGIMEGANRGAHDVNGKSIGVGIVLPMEEEPNPYVTPELTFKFHYFSLRKMHFLMRAQALVAFPGGFGTLDELFETLTLMQTRKIRRMPIVLFGREFWDKIINFEALVEEGVVSPQDLDLFTYANTAEEAWQAIEPHLKENIEATDNL